MVMMTGDRTDMFSWQAVMRLQIGSVTRHTHKRFLPFQRLPFSPCREVTLRPGTHNTG